MFFNSAKKKLAKETAETLIAGHSALLALWTLLHAGVIEAMLQSKDGIDPKAFAAATAMDPAILEPLLQYLQQKGLTTESEGRFSLSPTGQALIEYESGVLDFVYAYQPVLQMLEHLLARLKSYGSGVSRKHGILMAANAQRYAAEVYPAIADALKKAKATHLLDLHCASGELLAHAAEKIPALVGVGLGTDAALVRAANDLFATQKCDKRFLAVPASGADALTDTRRTFERTGISQQLWDKLDTLVACGMFGDLNLLLQGPERITAMLAAGLKALPKATFIIAEPCAPTRGEQPYYSPDMLLLLRLSRLEPLTAKAWTQIFQDAGLKCIAREKLATDGICLWTCVAAP